MRFRYSPAVVCGFAVAVSAVIPGLKNITCCFAVPLAAYLSLYINQRIEGRHHISGSAASVFGLLTGLFAAVFSTSFEALITFAARQNDLIASLPEIEKLLKQITLPDSAEDTMKLFRMMSQEIKQNGFSAAYTVILFFSNLTVDIIFGLLGGFIGASYLNKKNFEHDGN